MPIDAFYESLREDRDDHARYRPHHRSPDRDARRAGDVRPRIARPHLRAYSAAAKIKCETLRTDPAIFDVGRPSSSPPQQVTGFAPLLPIGAADIDERRNQRGKPHPEEVDLISYITRARVPMPKSTQDFLDSCDTFYRAGERAAAGEQRNALSARVLRIQSCVCATNARRRDLPPGARRDPLTALPNAARRARRCSRRQRGKPFHDILGRFRQQKPQSYYSTSSRIRSTGDRIGFAGIRPWHRIDIHAIQNRLRNVGRR